jgi:hypothetical protein
MKTVFDAIYSKIQGSALETAVGHRYYPMEAPANTAFPCLVSSIISETGRQQLNYLFIDVLVELSVLAKSITSMHTVSELVFSLFDDASLSVTNYRQLGTLDREIAQPLPEDGVYRYAIEYRLKLQKV